MKKSFIWIGSVIGAGAVLALVFGWLERPREVRTVSVSGECLTTAPKDRTAITLRVTTLDTSAAVSMKQATAKATEITEYLKKQDVQMQTTDFNSYEKSEWNRELQKSETLGIETSIAIEVSAASIDTIEKILTHFAGQPNVYSENLRMFTSNETMKPIMEKCLGTAVENARTRADALTAGDGRHTGKMLAVSYDVNTRSSYQPLASNFLRASVKESADAGAYVGGGLVAKDTEVSVTVSATFEIR